MPAKKINPKKRYVISLKKPVKVGRAWLQPGNKNNVSGDTLELIKDDVLEYQEVA